MGTVSRASSADEVGAPVSFAAIAAALLLAGLAFWATAYLAQLLVLALLLAGGVPGTVIVGALAGLEIERGTLRLVTGWRPARLHLVATGLPVAAAVVIAHGLMHWASARGSALAGAAGLLGQAVLLARFSTVTD